MARPWETVARGCCPEGALELRRRGEEDYLITLAGRVLMNSRAQRSEAALAEQGCAHLSGREESGREKSGREGGRVGREESRGCARAP